MIKKTPIYKTNFDVFKKRKNSYFYLFFTKIEK